MGRPLSDGQTCESYTRLLEGASTRFSGFALPFSWVPCGGLRGPFSFDATAVGGPEILPDPSHCELRDKSKPKPTSRLTPSQSTSRKHYRELLIMCGFCYTMKCNNPRRTRRYRVRDEAERGLIRGRGPKADPSGPGQACKRNFAVLSNLEHLSRRPIVQPSANKRKASIWHVVPVTVAFM